MDFKTCPLRPTTTPGPQVVLTCGDHLGTLAAARDLGRMGVSVVLADADATSLTARSRFVDRRLSPPALDQPKEWLAWMVDFGKREPGHVLLATSDDICWLLDTHRRELQKWFRLYQAPPGRTWQLLNKHLLNTHCAALGIQQPEQWNATEALARAKDLPYPVIIKPCTQAGMRKKAKGLVARSDDELRRAIDSLRDRHGWHSQMLAHDENVDEMVVQAFQADAERDIYSLSGFYSPETDAFLVRASQKVLQQPMRVGVGLCFESRPVNTELAADLRRLFDRVGHRGAFEVEYLRTGDGRHLLIDVNPRFFGQMAFDIARGLAIPRLCWYAATEQWDELRRASMIAKVTAGPNRSCDSWMLRLYATTHLIGGNFNVAEWRFWLDWSRDEMAADFVAASDDPAPAAQLRWRVGQDIVRRPRSTLRRFFMR